MKRLLSVYEKEEKKEKRKHWSLQSGRGRRLHTDVRPGALKLTPYGRAFSLHVLDSVDSGTEKCFFPLVLYQCNGFSRAAQRRGFICFACQLRWAAWWACSVLFYILYAVSEQRTYTRNSNRCKKHTHILCTSICTSI